MATKQIKLSELKVSDLKKELEERELETTGLKTVLQSRLRQALIDAGENPEDYVFEIPCGVSDIGKLIQENSRSLETKLEENSKNLETKLEENSRILKGDLEENCRILKEELTATLKEDSKILREELEENSRKTQEDLKNLKEEYDKKLEELQEKFTRITSSSMSDTDVVKAGLIEEKKVVRPGTSSTMHIKTPEFDGKSSWPNYLKQFEAAAKAHNWTLTEKATALTVSLRGEAIDILQTLKEDEQENYDQLVKRLDMRYGNAHLEQVYQTQLRNRYQSSKEKLQEFEADVARLVRLAHPTAPDSVLECLATQTFIYGVRDSEIQQALRLARPKTLGDALSYALDHEAAKQASRNQSQVRNIDAERNENTEDLDERVRRIVSDVFAGKKKLRCWNCGELGHPQRLCRKLQTKTEARKEEKVSGN